MTTTDDTPAPVDYELPAGVPVFGRNPHSIAERPVRQFALEVEVQVPASRGVRPHVERSAELFHTYTDLDGGAVLGLMRSRSKEEQAQRVAVLLGTTLVDDDGVPVEWVTPVEPEYDDDGAIIRGDATPEHPQGEPLYLDWQGDLVTADELRFDELTEGSSRRRFSVIMDSTAHRVRIEALNEIAEWLTEGVVALPTLGPAPSQRGQRATPRTRGGRSRR